MIAFRCRKHRAERIQKLWQVRIADGGVLAGRPIEGSYKDADQKPGGWALEERALTAGLYCRYCLDEGHSVPLPDYEEGDLRDAGLMDAPHVGTTAAHFDLDAVWDGFVERFGHLIMDTSDRAARPGKTDKRLSLDERICPSVRRAVDRLLGGRPLYTHQLEAIDAALDGRDVAIETPTASGKSLCYWIPILNKALVDEMATALYLAPLNALIEDQLAAVDRFGVTPTEHFTRGTLPQYTRQVKTGSGSVPVARYEGSIKDRGLRREIRESDPRIVITNPDMLHYSLLPNHKRLWQQLFANLQFIVIDEMHVYKGMFGANFANVLRRVLRIAGSYGQTPQIIACSASIGNPRELFEAITGRTDPKTIRASASGAPLSRQMRVVLDLSRAEEAMPTLAKE